MNFCDSQADTRLEETLPCNAEHVGLYILALQHFLGHWKSLYTWECLPVTGLQISAPAVVTNPELEELGGGGAAPHLGRVGGLHPWEPPAACTGRPKLSPQQGCKSHVCFPTMIPGGFTHTHTKAQHQQEWLTAVSEPHQSLGVWGFNACRLGKASKPDPTCCPATWPPGPLQEVRCCFLIRTDCCCVLCGPQSLPESISGDCMMPRGSIAGSKWAGMDTYKEKPLVAYGAL